MRICLCVGHSKLASGLYTSADGTEYGGCNEYKYNKKLVKQVAKRLKHNGHKVTTVICPENRFNTVGMEKTYKLNIVNSGNYDLCIELHLNAAKDLSANGCETLYYSHKGHIYAGHIHAGLSKKFKGRGAKKRDDLYMLTKTKCPAVICETFFCTNQSDYKKAKGLANRKKIAKLIADNIKDVY